MTLVNDGATDAVLCATIDQHNPAISHPSGDDGVSWASTLAFLYSAGTLRASAAVRRLVRARLVQRVDRRIGCQGYALTIEGFAIAVTEKPACHVYMHPVEPGPTIISLGCVSAAWSISTSGGRETRRTPPSTGDNRPRNRDGVTRNRHRAPVTSANYK